METMDADKLLCVRSYPPGDLEVLIEEVMRRATMRAALVSAHARGRNDRHFADELAVTEMRTTLNQLLPVGAEVVIGEGERDEAPMLYIGERLGPNQDRPPQLLIAVDPLEGTNLAADWMPGAICVIAAVLVGEGTLWGGVDGYMDKFVVGKPIADKLRALRSEGSRNPVPQFDPKRFILDQPIQATVNLISHFTCKPVTSIVAEVLERPRNDELVAQLRKMHVQVRLIGDGDVTSAWRALSDDEEVDFYVGIGAAPEGVLAAAMANVAEGYMEGRCWFDGTPKGDHQRQRLLALGTDIVKVYTIDDLASGNVIFSFTAVTDSMMPGVFYRAGGIAHTHTITGRSRTGTYYHIEGTHKNPPPPPQYWPGNNGK